MADVQKIVLDQFQDLYGDPKRDDLEAFFEKYEKALAGWSDEILTRAVDIVIREHEFPSWPMPGAVTKACQRVCPPPRLVNQPLHDEPEPLTPEQQARWEAIYQETMGFLKATTPKAKRPEDTSRPAFEKMQRESKNSALHMTPEGLTALSKRITGERE